MDTPPQQHSACGKKKNCHQYCQRPWNVHDSDSDKFDQIGHKKGSPDQLKQRQRERYLDKQR